MTKHSVNVSDDAGSVDSTGATAAAAAPGGYDQAEYERQVDEAREKGQVLPAPPGDNVDGGSTETPDRYIAYGEYRDVDAGKGDGSTEQVEVPYDEPRIVDELAPNQRGAVYSGDDSE